MDQLKYLCSLKKVLDRAHKRELELSLLGTVNELILEELAHTPNPEPKTYQSLHFYGKDHPKIAAQYTELITQNERILVYFFPVVDPQNWCALDSGHYYATFSSVGHIPSWQKPFLISINDKDDGLWQKNMTSIEEGYRSMELLMLLAPWSPVDFPKYGFVRQ